jgi:hypothetical protein
MNAFPVFRQRSETTTISVPLEGARSARIKLEHGAGKLKLTSGAASVEILNGTFGNEMDWHSRLEGDQLKVHLRNSPHFWSWAPGSDLDWDVHLNDTVPLYLRVESGASVSTLDLTGLKVIELKLNTGASRTEVTLPDNAGNTLVDIHAGAASVNIHIPMGVSASIRVKGGLSSATIDLSRFPSLGSGQYQSVDFATAANRTDITIDSGVGSIVIN